MEREKEKDGGHQPNYAKGEAVNLKNPNEGELSRDIKETPVYDLRLCISGQRYRMCSTVVGYSTVLQKEVVACLSSINCTFKKI